MAQSMKTLIERKFYRDGETARRKLDVFFAVDRLTEEEYTALMALVGSSMGVNACDNPAGTAAAELFGL